jgi:hypothetical protein
MPPAPHDHGRQRREGRPFERRRAACARTAPWPDRVADLAVPGDAPSEATQIGSPDVPSVTTRIAGPAGRSHGYGSIHRVIPPSPARSSCAPPDSLSVGRFLRHTGPRHLVKRSFTADGPNQRWLSDVTEHRTLEGDLYLCAIKNGSRTGPSATPSAPTQVARRRSDREQGGNSRA